MLIDYLTLMFELVVGFIGLLISVRIIGRRQLSQVTPFDFVSAVTLGEFVGNVPYSKEVNWIKMVVAIAFWTLLSYLMEIISVKFIRMREVVSGTPAVVIEKGKIQFDVMKKEKIDFNELLSMLRLKDIFSVQEVQYAFIENNGMMTVLKKKSDSSQNTTSQKEPPLTLPIIVDGKILKNNLTLLNITEDEVKELLTKHGLTEARQVMYAEYDNESFYFQLYNEGSAQRS